jgi:hypothetical protein
MLEANNFLRSVDPIIDHYKKFVDRAKLRENLTLSVDQRIERLRDLSAASYQRRRPPGPDRPWEAVSDCGPNRQSDPITELYKRDVDRTLLRENLKLEPGERLAKLAGFVRLAQRLRKANSDVDRCDD